MTNAHIGLIGETAVKLKLLEMGWNAINLNDAIPNFKGADLICIKDGETRMIQVKTSPSPNDNPNIMTGFVSDHEGNIKNLEEKVVCSWVFVHVRGVGTKAEYNFYILTRQEVIDLITTSNDWYVKRKKDTGKDIQIGLYLSWIRGIGYNPSAKDYHSYKSVIKEDSKDRWEKIFCTDNKKLTSSIINKTSRL